MKNFKKLALLATSALLTLALLASGCGDNASSDQKSAGSDKNVTLKVGASPVPHAEILNEIKPLLAKEGVDLQVVEFTDYVTPNLSLNDKELDADFTQHTPYLDKFNEERGTKLLAIGKVHIEPMGIYSSKVKKIDELTDGAKVAIPNDPTNGGRALLLLQKAGLIELKDGGSIASTVQDIVKNEKNIKITELDAPQIPRSLNDVDIALINTNFALSANLNPTKDAIFIEDKDSPYANVLAVRAGDENRPEIQKLMKALNSPEVRKFIQDKYQGAIVPAF